jgi:hypothetical protein
MGKSDTTKVIGIASTQRDHPVNFWAAAPDQRS